MAEKTTGRRGHFRIAAYILAVLAAAACLFGGWLALNADAIKNAVVGRLNEHLDAPVSVKSIDLGWFAHFPSISLTFREVVVLGSGRHRADTLARAKKLYFTLNAWHAFRGRYELKTAGLEDAGIRMVRYPDGTNNWDIIKPDTAKAGPKSEGQGFAIKVLKGSQIRYVYQDSGKAGTFLDLSGEKLKASFSYKNQTTSVTVALQGYLRKLSEGEASILAELPVALGSSLTVSKQAGIRIAASSLELGKAGFEASGLVSVAHPGQYSFQVEGKKTTLAHLGVLLPARLRSTLDSYRSSGQVIFTTEIAKKSAKTRYPAVKARFNCQNAGFQHDTLKLRFAGLNMEGSFSLPEGNTLDKGALNLAHFKGALNGRPISGKLLLQNLSNPTISGRLKAAAPLAMFEASLRQASIASPAGTIAADIQILPSRLGKSGALVATGSLDLEGIGFDAGSRRLAFRGWRGRLDISQGSVSAEGLAGMIGRSDFRVDGHFENLLGYLKGVRPQLGVEASIQSSLIDLDELLGTNDAATAPAKTAENGKGGAGEEEYRFSIAPHLRLTASCQAGLVRFRRARIRNFQGNVGVADKVLNLEGISFQMGGGRATLNGSLDTRAAGIIANRYRFQVSGIRMDSALYALENFDQGYLRSDNIRGRVNALGTLSFQMSDRLDVDSRTAEAEADISISQGTLLNFEPLQAMAKYIESQELENLKFSDLTNHLTIRNRTVTIPEMEIKSNAANLVVQGYHSFDQNMHYRIRVPLKNVRMKSGLFKTAEGSALEGNLFLLMTGTPGNLKVAIDKEATGEKINQDLKASKKRFLDLFKKKNDEPWETTDGKRTDELPEEEKKKEKPKDEFFDFE